MVLKIPWGFFLEKLPVPMLLFLFLSGFNPADGRYIYEKEGFLLEPPSGWELLGPGQYRELRFKRDNQCMVSVQPTSRAQNWPVAEYVKKWEERALRPGSNFEKRVNNAETIINGYPVFSVDYTGRLGKIPVAFIKLPHQNIIVALECRRDFQGGVKQWVKVIYSIRSLEKGTAKQKQTKAAASPQSVNRPQAGSTKPPSIHPTTPPDSSQPTPAGGLIQRGPKPDYSKLGKSSSFAKRATVKEWDTRGPSIEWE